eukprot:COSAG05_NODE_993_length_6264_cov_294.754096_1_plen_96_part_00
MIYMHQTANFFKEKGNTAFKDTKLEKALEFYEQGRRYATAENYQKLSEEQTARQTAILLNCRNNMAHCYSRQGNMARALENFEEVLKIEVLAVLL